jgi:hypothetical protein
MRISDLFEHYTKTLEGKRSNGDMFSIYKVCHDPMYHMEYMKLQNMHPARETEMKAL